MSVAIKCENCGVEFRVKPSRAKRGVKYCSMVCREQHKYTGKFIRSDGYIAIKRNGKFELEHRIVMSEFLKRDLRTDEHIHHRNGNKSDNRIENLELVTIGGHISKYHPSQIDKTRWQECKCLLCGKLFERRIVEVERHPNPFCSRECYIKGKQAKLCP